MDEGARANNTYTYAASLCAHVYVYIHTYIYIYIHTYTHTHIHISSSLSLSPSPLSLYVSLSAHFCPTTAARATDNVISIYIYASDRPRLSIQTMHDTSDTVRHFGIASRIFPPSSCLFDKVIALWYFNEFNITFLAETQMRASSYAKFLNPDIGK